MKIQTPRFTAAIDENSISLTNQLSAYTLDIKDSGYEIICDDGDVSNLKHESIYTQRDNSFSYAVKVTNTGGIPVTIKKVILLKGSVHAESVSHSDDKMNNYPILIDDNIFCGIDWPVARNHYSNGKIECTQFCNVTLQPGELFTTKTMSFGVAKKNFVSQAFLRHLEEIRGRTTQRKSMYFTWLAHAWEGLSPQSFQDLIDYLIMLHNEYAIHFDVILLDAGIIETLHTYFDHYGDKGKATIDSISQAAEKLKAIGSDMGIWLGPDGFGDSECFAEKRIETVKKMVTDWNVSMIKLDAAVSNPITGNIENDEKYMNHLYRQMEALRKICPHLVVINHRVSASPYILSVLDSTLWEGMETYPDVYLMNLDKPRTASRMATYSRGIPTYLDCYSHLLEDHGVCFNGVLEGWEEDFLIQAFGRSLVVSPEIYGTLFCLGDEAYKTFAYLMALAERFKALRENTIAFEDMYVHCDGNQMLLCVFNDTFSDAEKQIDIDKYLTCGTYKADILYPIDMMSCSFENKLNIILSPFQTVLILVTKGKDKAQVEEIDLRNVRFSFVNGFNESLPTSQDRFICEKIPFALSSNPVEFQVLSEAEDSKHPEVNQCRKNFIRKIKKSFGVDQCAWDGSAATAWGDKMHYDKLNAVWRLNLGKAEQVKRIEITLSGLRPGPVIDMENGRELSERITVQVSSDCMHWHSIEAKHYKRRIMDMEFPEKIIADFDREYPIQYLKFHFNGVLIGNIAIENAFGEELDSSLWKGNNLLPNVSPLKVFYKKIDLTGDTDHIAVNLSLPDCSIPLSQMIALAWVEDSRGGYIHAQKASPLYPFNGWENNTDYNGNAWSYTIDGLKGMQGAFILKCAVFEPQYNPQGQIVERYHIDGGVFL